MLQPTIVTDFHKCYIGNNMEDAYDLFCMMSLEEKSCLTLGVSFDMIRWGEMSSAEREAALQRLADQEAQCV